MKNKFVLKLRDMYGIKYIKFYNKLKRKFEKLPLVVYNYTEYDDNYFNNELLNKSFKINFAFLYKFGSNNKLIDNSFKNLNSDYVILFSKEKIQELNKIFNEEEYIYFHVFTLLHEVGHYVLRHNDVYNYEDYIDKKELYYKLETQANDFAIQYMKLNRIEYKIFCKMITKFNKYIDKIKGYKNENTIQIT